MTRDAPTGAGPSAALERWLAGASSAEEIFAALEVPCDPAVLAVHRLHILKRFGDALSAHPSPDVETARACLVRACAEVGRPDARRETGFAVFRQQSDASGRAFVPLTALGGVAPAAAAVEASAPADSPSSGRSADPTRPGASAPLSPSTPKGGPAP